MCVGCRHLGEGVQVAGVCERSRALFSLGSSKHLALRLHGLDFTLLPSGRSTGADAPEDADSESGELLSLVDEASYIAAAAAVAATVADAIEAGAGVLSGTLHQKGQAPYFESCEKTSIIKMEGCNSLHAHRCRYGV